MTPIKIFYGRRLSRIFAVVVISCAGLIVFGILVAMWLFPNSYRLFAAQLYSWSARVAALMGNRQIAYLAANRAVALAPANVEYLNKRCWYGSLAGDVKNVIADCYRVVEMEPDELWVRDTLGVALVFMKDYPAALAEFQFIVDHNHPANPDYQYFRERLDWIDTLKKEKTRLTSRRSGDCCTSEPVKDKRTGTGNKSAPVLLSPFFL